MVDAHAHWMDVAFGARRRRFWRRPSFFLTAPVFMARGHSCSDSRSDSCSSGGGSNGSVGDEDRLRFTSRTDLHCEPITNIVMQTEVRSSDSEGAYLCTGIVYPPFISLSRAPLCTGRQGRKRWVLVAPEQSRVLKPAVSPDGRAYFYSMLDPLDPSALALVPRYEVETEAGDVLYVPAWFWCDPLPRAHALCCALTRAERQR